MAGTMSLIFLKKREKNVTINVSVRVKTNMDALYFEF